MARLTQPLRDEHKELLPHVEMIRTIADSIGLISIEGLQEGLHEVHVFLSRHLIPHAAAEDRVLYPLVGRVMGAPQATATMSRDHLEIAHLTIELGVLRAELEDEIHLRADQVRALRRILYGLYTLIKTHFAKEEEIYLPLLDNFLSVDDAQRMFQQLEEEAHDVKMHAAVH